MFEVNLDDTEYKASFTHIMVTRMYPRRATKCTITNAANDIIVCIGWTKVHPQDHYNKDIGRKLSLKRALAQGGFRKEERTKFWEKYFEACEGKVLMNWIDNLQFSDQENAFIFEDGEVKIFTGEWELRLTPAFACALCDFLDNHLPFLSGKAREQTKKEE